jgi:hypothetical protein
MLYPGNKNVSECIHECSWIVGARTPPHIGYMKHIETQEMRIQPTTMLALWSIWMNRLLKLNANMALCWAMNGKQCESIESKTLTGKSTFVIDFPIIISVYRGLGWIVRLSHIFQ